MPKDDCRRREHDILSTAEAAERMGVSRRRMRNLCGQGLLPEAFQEWENGPWHIPVQAVEDWNARHPTVEAKTPVQQEVSHPASSRREYPAWRTKLQRLRNHPLVVALSVLVVVITLLAALISAGADIGGARRQLQEWGLLRAFPVTNENEILIVIASFYRSEGIPDTEAHNEIRRAIQEAAEELSFSHLRVEVETIRLTADDRAGAEKLGKRYNASMVIWGADTGVRVTVNYLNIKQPDFEAAEVQISETERTQLANPSAYATFVTTDLPNQLVFLSLFAIGQSYYIEGAYAESIKVFERAISSVNSEIEPLEGLADAYFYLGWLKQVPERNTLEAIAAYDNAIALDPDRSMAYNNRGAAYLNLKDLERASADLDRAIALASDNVIALINRGSVRAVTGDFEGAFSDYDQAIALQPNHAEAYYNRANAYYDFGDLDRSIADFDKAVDLHSDLIKANSDPDQAMIAQISLADAYYSRGLAHLEQGDFAVAMEDFNDAIALNSSLISLLDQTIAKNPDDALAYYVRGLIRAEQGDLKGAVADYDRAIALQPDFAPAYNDRGLARRAVGDLPGAIADYDKAIELEPEYTSAYNNRGNARANIGDSTGAIADYDRATALQPDLAAAYSNRAGVLFAHGDLRGALADLDKAISLEPELGNAYHGRGVVHRELGNAEMALADFRQYLELVPDAYDRWMVEEWIAELEAQTSEPEPN